MGHSKWSVIEARYVVHRLLSEEISWSWSQHYSGSPKVAQFSYCLHMLALIHPIIARCPLHTIEVDRGCFTLCRSYFSFEVGRQTFFQPACCCSALDSLFSMGWSDVSGFSDLQSLHCKEETKLAQLAKSRSRSPRRTPFVSEDVLAGVKYTRTLECLGVHVVRPCPQIATLPGTEWWATPLLQSLEHIRLARGPVLRPITIESSCSGTGCEAWIAQVFLTNQMHPLSNTFGMAPKIGRFIIVQQSDKRSPIPFASR